MPYAYKVNGQAVSLEADPSVVAVRFNRAHPNSVRAMATEAAMVGPFSRRFDVPGENFTLVPVEPAKGAARATKARAGRPAQPQMQAAIQALNTQPAVDNALPVFRVNGSQVIAPDRLIVGVKDVKSAGALARKYKLKRLDSVGDNIVFGIAASADPFDVARQLDADPRVRFAEPDFIVIGRHAAKSAEPKRQTRAGKSKKASQYAMTITKASKAWKIQPGDPKIKIAVLDEGVDTKHPDLAPAIVGTYDAVDNDTFQEPNGWDGHGTACAGLAVAQGTGRASMRGAGTGCSLLAVRIGSSLVPNFPMVTSSIKLVAAIKWAVKNGADVLSNSWSAPPSNAIAEAFEKARRKGRKGLGCVIVIAAGNESGPVVFPGQLPNVLTVAASNEFDEFKSPTSRDGETGWGSCFGPEVGIAAPGVHNRTTDISSKSGYDPGNYAGHFGGTSASAPIVAGACGLVLSANPKLRESEVRAILQNTADKVGKKPYGANGRNNFFGAGRLNVLAAVKAARAMQVAPAAKPARRLGGQPRRAGLNAPSILQ